MLGLLVSVPIACWRKGHAREYLETECLPPPATCYGFLLALIGEENRQRHSGARVTAGIVRAGEISAVLRTLWRVKDRKLLPGTKQNVRPDFQQLTTGSLLTIWVERGDEEVATCLEQRVRAALTNPGEIDRFGGLSLGESTHLVDSINEITGEPPESEIFLLDAQGRMSLPVWVDHVGSVGTRYAVGNMVRTRLPDAVGLPVIRAT